MTTIGKEWLDTTDGFETIRITSVDVFCERTEDSCKEYGETSSILAVGSNNLIIGENIKCFHDNCIMIGSNLTSTRDGDVRIGDEVSFGDVDNETARNILRFRFKNKLATLSCLVKPRGMP